jgi:hypothetical protein
MGRTGSSCYWKGWSCCDLAGREGRGRKIVQSRQRTAHSRREISFIADPRLDSSSDKKTSDSSHLNALKQCHIVAFQNLFLVSGFSKSRERQILLFDTSSSSSLAPVSTIRIDFETSPLIPVVDNYRRIAYVAGKGDSSLRWWEVSDKLAVTNGAFSLPIGVAGMALIGQHGLDVMKAEINRLIVLPRSGNDVLPLSIRVPKRHLIDFHDDIFPLVRSQDSNRSAREWLGGGAALPDLVSLDPARRQKRKPRAATTVDGGAPGADQFQSSREAEGASNLPRGLLESNLQANKFLLIVSLSSAPAPPSAPKAASVLQAEPVSPPSSAPPTSTTKPEPHSPVKKKPSPPSPSMTLSPTPSPSVQTTAPVAEEK